MEILASIFVAVIAIEHVYILILEMFLWTTPRGLRAFGMKPAEAEATNADAGGASSAVPSRAFPVVGQTGYTLSIIGEAPFPRRPRTGFARAVRGRSMSYRPIVPTSNYIDVIRYATTHAAPNASR